MTLQIFLDDKSLNCLKQSIPHGSKSESTLENALHFANFTVFGSNAVITCDEAAARNLLSHAIHCPGVTASIHKAFYSAGFTSES
jgi:hypothetical protein